MSSYFVYGLNIESDLEFDELLPAKGAIDVTFKLDKIENKPEIPEGKQVGTWSTPTEACIAARGVATFLARNGNEMIIDLEENANPREVGHALLGIALSSILYQRGFLVLHCSLVEVNGYAVGFLGHSGNGKSSIATAMYESGHKLISDDLGVIDFDIAEQVVVYSGFPQLKLWPDLLESIGTDPENLPIIQAGYTKRAHLLHERFTEKAYIPLKCLYLLDEADEIGIEEVKGHQVVMELVTYSYDINLIRRVNALPEHLLQCTQLASKIPVRRLSRPWSLELMPKIVKALEADLENL